jgi:hypothetical protein
MGIEMTSCQPPVAVNGLSEKLEEIRDHLEGIKMELEHLPPIPQDAMTYTEVKMQLMVNYVANLAFYLSLKQKGESVADHPVFRHLAYLRTFMERLAPLDAALKYQIDRLLMQNTDEEDIETPVIASAGAGPNLAAFVPVKSAAKGISVEQVKKSLGMAVSDIPTDGTTMEIDPSLIAARIAKLQEAKSKPAVSKKTRAEISDEDEFSDVSEIVVKKRKKKTASVSASKKKNTPVDDDDESIDSDDIDL